ncbi:hypothetical protein D3C76_1302280 [compost metagenome]
MQEQVVLAQRLTMVRQVKHGSVDFVLFAAQDINQRRQHMIGIDQRIVIRIDDALFAALVQRVTQAHRHEAFERHRVALEVLRPMTTHLVQDQHGVLLQVVNHRAQALQENLVMAFAISTQRRVFAIADIFVLHPVARALAA